MTSKSFYRQLVCLNWTKQKKQPLISKAAKLSTSKHVTNGLQHLEKALSHSPLLLHEDMFNTALAFAHII